MRWAERALAITPGGAQTRSKRPEAFPWPPIVLSSGSGSCVYDTSGREYLDYILGLGSVGLGHSYPSVTEAVCRQAWTGVSLPLATDLEVRVAEAIGTGTEQVRFTKTGSEATEGAMRIARLATGRDVIVSIGYHGWHSVHDAASDDHPGVPAGYLAHHCGVPYNDLPALEAVMSRSVAAVLMEPVRDEEPEATYLPKVRALCTTYGALLIFDEIVTGFRWALAGGQEYFGIRSDLSCYGKALANGYPLACIVGSRHLMTHAAHVSGTYGGECVSLAACLATLGVYRTEPVIRHLWAYGHELIDQINRLHGPLQLGGYAVRPQIVGETPLPLLAALAQKGVLWHPKGLNISYSHDERVLRETLAAYTQAAEVLRS